MFHLLFRQVVVIIKGLLFFSEPTIQALFQCPLLLGTSSLVEDVSIPRIQLGVILLLATEENIVLMRKEDVKLIRGHSLIT